MELTTTSILTLVIGLIIGGAIVFVIYYIINKKRTNKKFLWIYYNINVYKNKNRVRKM